MALTDNLIAYWNFDADNSNDSVGSHHGTDTNMAYGSSNGKIGHGANFATATSRILVTSTDWNFGTGNFTLSCWAHATGTGAIWAYGPILWGNTGSGSHRFVLVWHALTGNIYGQVYDGSNHIFASVTNAAYQTLNTWHHIAFTRNGTTGKLYIDGAEVASSTIATTPNLTDSGTGEIGKVGATSGRDNFRGYIDEMGIWTRALSSGEIAELYNSGAGFAYPFSAGGSETDKFFLMF